MDGIVTLEDLLEEIVGEIEDEFDLPGHVDRAASTRTRIRIDGTYTIDDFNEAFGTELEQEDYHTLAGLVFGALGRAAEVGDEVAADGLRAHRARGRGLADPHGSRSSSASRRRRQAEAARREDTQVAKRRLRISRGRKPPRFRLAPA